MKKIELVEVYFEKNKVGRLAQTKEGICAFEYDANYLANGISISPFELPLKNGVMLARRHPFGGNFGVFDDCLPDGWGLLVLDRYLQKHGIHPKTLSIPDRLSLVGSSGRGAIEFHPVKRDKCNFACFAWNMNSMLENVFKKKIVSRYFGTQSFTDNRNLLRNQTSQILAR